MAQAADPADPADPAAQHRYTANISILFTALPLLERPAAAAAAGFKAVELWWPWPGTPVPEKSQLAGLRRALNDAGTTLTGLNFYSGRLPGPDRGALSLPGTESERFRRNVDVAVEFADSVGCRALNALYGNRMPGVAPEEQDALALENLASAARAAHGIGATLLIEALNRADSPHYPLQSAAEAVRLADRVDQATGLGNATFQMDLYHLAVNGEDLHRVIAEHTVRTGHVQIADHPGRGAPGTGRLDVPDLLRRLTEAGYRGRISLEHLPGDRPGAECFDWLPRALRGA